MQVYFKADTNNTGAATLNLNGLGAVAIKKDATDDLEDDDIVSGQIVHVVYDGTNWQLNLGISSEGMFSGSKACASHQRLGNILTGSAGCLYDPTTGVAGGATKVITAAISPAPVTDGGDFIEGTHCYVKLGGSLSGATSVQLTLNGIGPKNILHANQQQIQGTDGSQDDIWHCVYDRANGTWFKIG
jgi:hypothetical protein